MALFFGSHSRPTTAENIFSTMPVFNSGQTTTQVTPPVSPDFSNPVKD